MQTAGLPWRFDARNGVGDPGGGGLRYNGDRPESTDVISVSDACFDRRNPDVSKYVATWDKSSNVDHRGTLVLTSATREGLAIFDIVGTATDQQGWTEIPVRCVQFFDDFENNETLTVQFFRTGDTAGVREVVREVVIQSVESSDRPALVDRSADISTQQMQIIELARALDETRTHVTELRKVIGSLVHQAIAAE